VFKGFYKDRHTKIGRFGGSNGDALVKGNILLQPPVLSRFECEVRVEQDDANQVIRRAQSLDLAYFDPPYNQHPYGSNYFMLNLLVHYARPEGISEVSGIPVGWRRSGYNVRLRSRQLLSDLIEATDSKFLLVSFNDEGFIRREEMLSMLRRVGSVETLDLPYNTLRGSRNLRNRSIHVTEQLFLVEKR
jgi:adenine-specific DNA-methyltransferase